MNATETTVNNAPAATRLSAHAECDHPRTKTARAACRRSRRAEWIDVTRLDVEKGDTVRVHTENDMLEGVLLGWGTKRLVVRVQDERVTLSTSDVLKIEGRNGS